MTEAGAVARPASSASSAPRRYASLLMIGLCLTAGAVLLTTVFAALFRAAGVDFAVADGTDEIPLAGVAVVTGACSVVGVVVAVAVLRWSSRPARRFVWIATSLTALSLVPPFLAGASAPTVAALVALHLIAAAVVIPGLAWQLRGWRD